MNPILPNADDLRGGTPMNTDDELRKEMRGVVTRAAMKNMTIPQAKIFALEVELYTDKYVQQLTAKASLHRAIDELEHMGTVEFDDVPMDIIRWRYDRIKALQAELQQAGKGDV